MKRIVIAALAALLILTACFAACGPKTPDPEDNKAKPITEINVNDLASKLASSCSFEDEYLALVEDREFSLQTYGIDPALVAEKDGVKESAIYVSASTPEMIVCVKAADEEAYSKIESAVKARIEDYINNYTTYGPEQVEKLKSAVMEQQGLTLIAVVSNDNSAARDTLAGLLK